MKMSIDQMKHDMRLDYYLQLADTLKYILQDRFIWMIKERCFDEGESI